jgi:hypothetical protein
MATSKESGLDQDPYAWVLEEAVEILNLRPKKMFGALAWYKGSKLLWVSAGGEEPWSGVLIPTDRPHHASLMDAFPGLQIHPILKKWLWAKEDHEAFEETLRGLVDLLLEADPRLGVIGKPKPDKGKPEKPPKKPR